MSRGTRTRRRLIADVTQEYMLYKNTLATFDSLRREVVNSPESNSQDSPSKLKHFLLNMK